MSNFSLDDSLIMKYSNSYYAIKDDLKEDQSIENIDDLWEQILIYRSHFVSTISLKHIDNKSFNICLTFGITNLINKIERKLFKLTNYYFGLEKINAHYEFKKLSYFDCLKSINEKYFLKIDDPSIKSIINESSTVLSPQEIQMNRFLKCLKQIETKSMQEIDNNFLIECYSLLTDHEDRQDIYRKNEIADGFDVPLASISDLMSQVLDFINTSTLGPLTTAAICLFYLNYIKPFELYNEDIALLLFKKILAFNDFGSIGAMINLESILNDDKFMDVIKISLKSYDLTYVLDYVCNKLEIIINKCIDDVAIAKSIALKEEFYEQELNNSSNSTSTNKDEISKTSIDFDLPSKDVTSKLTNQKETSIYSKGTIAFSNIPSSLNEEQIKLLERTLLELEPRMSKAQAYFYARHCTIGMNYKISDFVEAVGCAYETARTSMDNLVYLGYYQKNAYKNKYIYTPIKKN